ncbi:MAG TPA: hypothetical protein DEO85_05605 [Maritimibacter sp.]|nr:hypothetical protein [Maritimibacter sp.]
MLTNLKRSSVLTLAILGTLFGASSATAERLTFATDIVERDPIYQHTLKPFFDETGEDTDVDAQWRFIPAGQLLGARESLSGIKSGLADATIVVPSFFRTDLPNINVLFQFVSFGENVIAGTGAALEALYLNCPECLDDYYSNDTVPLASSSGGQYYLYCSDPVSSLGDLKGRKIRGVGAMARLIEAVGATPLSLPPNEGVTAIQRGTMDCAIGPLAWLTAFGYGDVAKNITGMPLGYTKNLGLIVMNQKKWTSLGVSQREGIINRMGAVSARMVITSNYNRDTEILSQGEARGLNFVEAEASLVDAFAQFNEAELEAVILAGEASGSANAREIVETMVALYPKWEQIAQETGFDVDAVAEAYQREIYGKLDPETFGVE